MGRVVAWLLTLAVLLLGPGVLTGAHALQHPGGCAAGVAPGPGQSEEDHPDRRERRRCDVCLKLEAASQPMLLVDASGLPASMPLAGRTETVVGRCVGVGVPELVRARPPPMGV